MTTASNVIGTEFKDSSPMKTVEKIKGILAENGIKTREQWRESKVPYCYSLTVHVEGVAFSTNGKGRSKEFALASAYGELMERLQLGFVGIKTTQKDGLFSANNSQDITLPAKQLLEQNLDWYQKIADRFFVWNGTKLSATDILMQYVDDQQNVKVTPYYNLTDGEITYMPSQLRRFLYSSNGCAAGNTMEEAIVQAIGEVVERHHSMCIIRDSICLPEVPEEVLKQYKSAYEVITFVRNQGYKVFVKDCSLGKKFPVVCVCYIHEKTGRYHTHFGAYPNFEIALTRALTETFQGRSIDSFAKHSDFLYDADKTQFLRNWSTEILYGTAERMPEFFVGDNKLEYNTQVGFKGTTNKELLEECVDFFAQQGYPILVRDASCLGFPTCQIIIPGYSETSVHRLLTKDDPNRLMPHAITTFRDPAKATVEDMLGCLMYVQKMNASAAGYKLGFLSAAKLMAHLSREEEGYLFSAALAYVHYALGQYSTACKYVCNMAEHKDNNDPEFLGCIKHYLELKAAGYPDHQIRELMELFHAPQTAARLYSFIDKHENPLAQFTLHCDLTSCSTCRIQEKCCQHNSRRLIDLINEKSAQLVFEDSVALLKSLI